MALTDDDSGVVRAGLLGPLEVTRAGRRVEPTSPKQRALLIDLLVHRGGAVSRDRLIDDLWGEQPPATASGVVQSYVSQLRRALGSEVVRTVGQGYAVDPARIALDVADLEAHLKRARVARTAGNTALVREAATEALALWRGEPLADVAFESFAQAEIARLRELRAVSLELALEAEIGSGGHRQAVAGLEAAVADHPLQERLWWLLMLALYRSGRQADALRAFQRARAILADEHGLDPGGALRELERAVLDQRPELDDLLLPAAPPRRPVRGSRPRVSLLGRTEEWSAIEAFLGSDDSGRLLVLLGEPGIGKTRLLEETHVHAGAAGGTVVAGRGFEAERGRPYGAWVDALRGAPLPDLDEPLRAALAPLLPELADHPVELDDPNRLYDAVVRVLAHLAAKGPVAVLLDDLHWLDEPSVALVHFAIRHLAHADVSFLATARPAELADNLACTRMLQALRREDALVELPVGPMPVTTIAQLTEPIAPGADPERIAEATNGNPLFALEMARALARGDDPLSSRVDALIGDRLARLDERAKALVPWLAACGRDIPPSLLAQLALREPAELFESIGDLELHGVLRANDDGNVEFVHDVVRAAAYKRLSTPRRAMLHARIAVVLASLVDPDASLAADTARHADAGGDSATCAAACVRAAQRCLRLLAYPEADQLVALGRAHTPHLPEPERVATELLLINVLLHPGVRLRDPGDLAGQLADLCVDAQRLGLDGELSTGLSLLARTYHWGWGDIPRARILMGRAATLIEGAREPSIEPLLEGARCLAYLEMDMERTARLFDELGTLHDLAAQSFQYQWGLGLVQAWRGEVDDARTALARAIDLAAGRGDHWVTFECTARLALLELETGDVAAAGPLCARLTPLADKLGDGSEQPYAAAISALGAVARGEAGGDVALDEAVAALHQIDASFLVPDLLGIASEVHYRSGHLDLADERARRARDVADTAARPFEAARAAALRACIAAVRDDVEGSRAHLGELPADSTSLPRHVEGLRREAVRLSTTAARRRGGGQWP